MITLKKLSLKIIIFTFVIGMLAILLLCVSKSRIALQENYENDNRVVAGLISNVLDNTFLRPITVAETIARDYTTKEILSFDTQKEAQKIAPLAAEHLKSLRDGFGYSMVYAVSDKSKTFFSVNGISKYIDVENDPADEWYRYFMEAKKPYLLYVDTDASQNWSLSVFVNTAVYDDDNSLIGVCGVAVDMQDMQRLLERYERIYDIKINLVNDKGLIQVDTDTERIERDSAHIDNLSAFSDGECYFEILPHGSRTITYLENLGWYLVIQNDEGRNKQVGGLIVPCIICIVICLAAAMLAIILGTEKKQKPDEVIRLSSSENNNEKQNK